MLSPNSITYHKQNISHRTSYSIQKQIIHIEAADFCKKLEYFHTLVDVGIKEIEIGFPAASQIEFDFLRQLVDRNLIPDDVMVQVLTQCREHLVKRTFEAIQGIKKAVVHIYNSTSTLQRDVVFHMDREEIKKIATDGVAMVKNYMKDHDGEVVLELGYHIFPAYRRRGYGLESCAGILEYGRRELEADRFLVRIRKENVPSLVLAEKLGFREK